ncbi:MAG: hypothetical protein QNJ03_15205 [Dinoroseobacter sp.]|nr:hypothetical protein [Dinoroseobacter sp.]
MTQDSSDTKPAAGGRPKWFFLAALAVAFTLSFVVGEVMGPVGAMLGLGLGAILAWAAAKWMYPVKEADE